MDKRKNIKIVFFSDTHLGFDYPLKTTSKPHRGEDFYNNFTRVLDRAKKINADLIIHGGDLFDKADVSQKIIDRCYDALYQVADFGIPTILIPGNHDKKKLPTSLFVEHPNLYFQNYTSSITLKLNGKEFDIHTLPYLKEIGNTIEGELSKLITDDDSNNYKILLMHQSLEGSKVGPVDFTFKNTKDTVGQSQIPSHYDLVLSGHIHRYQVLEIATDENKKIPFIYSGSTERTSFSEIKEEKGFVVLEFKRNKSFLSPEITFEKLPMRTMHDIIIERNITDDKEIEKELIQRAKDIEANAIIRVVSDNDETKLKLKTKLLKKCFSESSIVSVKGLSSLYRTPKYK
ncbi:MAG: DNA repair exonuclease [Bacteroidota bacterium]